MIYDYLLKTSEKEMRKNINLQVLAKYLPAKVIIPPNYTPRTAVEKWISKLLERNKK